MRKWVVAVMLVAAASCAEQDSPDAPPHPFATGPEAPLPDVEGKTTFELMVIGDFGTGSAAEHDVADAMQDWHDQFDVDAIVTTGDNIYPDGNPQDFERAWNEPFDWVERESLDVVASLGNHDVITAGGRPVMDLFGMPGPYYDVTIGDAEIFVLDGNNVTDSGQIEWLNRQLARSKTEWQIAVFHQPAYSCSRHGSTTEVVETWVPLFKRFGVDLVLTGHDHVYQRFEAEKGVTYVVTGGGGNFLDGAGDCPGSVPTREAAVEYKHHFVVLKGSAEDLAARVVGLDQPKLDEFTLSPNP
jgi:3',5'-cyclic AMP phosphodiesterase CpdA